MKAFVEKHPVVTYFILTFVITWGAMLAVIGAGGVLGTSQVSEDLLPFVYLAMLVGPTSAGILSTALVDGRAGFHDLRSRLLRWRVGARWYAVALLTAPVLIVAILLALSLVSRAYLPTIVTSDGKPGLLVTGIVMGLAVGFFEELGWTGFAIPRLRRRYGGLASGLIVGFLWGAWHFPAFSGSAGVSGPIPPTLYLIVLLFSFLPAYRVLMVWVYDHTQSLLTLVLMHAPLAGSQLVLIPAAISGVQAVTYDLLFATALWILVVAIVTTGKWRPSVPANTP